jgi:molybdate transport system ATP-binding protein
VQRCADLFSIDHLLQRPFGYLSYGQQRMVLIARSVIKKPCILILDEPCQGLDPANRRNVLSMADAVTRKTETQLIYVSHAADERPQSINRQLDMSGPPYPTKVF